MTTRISHSVQDVQHRAAVLGSPIRHSLSPVLHTAAYEALGLNGWEYTRQEVTEKKLAAFFSHLDPSWAGVSMTMPLKKEALRFADTRDSRVAYLGVANTAVFDWTRQHQDGSGVPSSSAAHAGFTDTASGHAGHTLPYIQLYNTDVDGIKLTFSDEFGMSDTSERSQAEASSLSALILGSGSTATSAIAALLEMGVRTLTICAVNSLQAQPVADHMAGYLSGLEPEPEPPLITVKPWSAAVEEILAADIIVSAVPAHATDELAQNIAQLPPSVRFADKRLLDVIYDPRPTQLMTQMEARDADVRGGEHMLLRQAIAQVAYMTRTPVQDVLDTAFDPMRAALFARL